MEFSNLKKIFSQDYFAIPDYQRDYEWTNAQNSTLLDDIVSLIDSDEEQKHFIGAIVTIPFEKNAAANICVNIDDFGIVESGIKHIVDGQQRLTSISILSKALVDSIENDNEIDNNEKDKQKDKMKSMLYGDDYNSHDNRAPKMLLNGNTGKYYNSEVLHTTADAFRKNFKGAKRIKNAYDLFIKEIQERKAKLIEHNVCTNASDFYKRMCDAITKQLVLVEIECDKSSNAFQVFDSLNGKGLDLTAADRIKNIMLSWAPAGQGVQKWEAFTAAVGEEYLASFFVSEFFYSQKKRISKNKLPDEFSKKYKDAAQGDFSYFFDEIHKKGELYGSLRNAKTESKKVNEMIKDLIQLKSEQSFVLIYSAAEQYGDEILKSSQYLEFLKALTTLIVRMQICERSTNKLDNIFSKCIEKMESASSLEVVTKYLRDKVKETVADGDFYRAFSKYSTSDNKVAEYYLRKIEAFERKEENNRNEVERGLTVEHIIPQGLVNFSDWYGTEDIPLDIKDGHKEAIVERLGNMALLFSDDNSSASNNNYTAKVNVYKNGIVGRSNGTPQNTFCLIKELLSEFPNKFDYNDVEKRSNKLADYAMKIWSTN